MTQPGQSNQQSLLNDLKQTPLAALEQGVAKQEGLPVNGSTLTPKYSNRNLVCYNILESELHQIGLANLGVTTAFSLGSAFIAFGIDMFKDTMLAESIPPYAQTVMDYAKPIVLFTGVALWFFGGLLIWWRRNMISLIKRESR